MSKDQYEGLINKSIHKEYKKSSEATVREVTKEDRRIATKLELSDRIDVTAKREAFITLKDHKPNFRNKPTCRLINPCKPELGKVSKQLVEKIVYDVKTATNIKHWKNTNDVVSWFNSIENKCKHVFISFDICDFYPSITNKLLEKSLTFASQFSNISVEDIRIIKHTKKTTLFKDSTPWAKKSSDFDVTMGSFDGAEVCELVGLYLPSQLQHLDMNVGLYRDDGLAVTKLSPQNTERMKKEICKIFKQNDLNITIEANKKTVDFLDITLDLRTGIYKPYRKPNSSVNYLHKDSNHPPSIMKNLPKSIEIRLSNNSVNEETFKEAAGPYNAALKENGHNYTLKYMPNHNRHENSKANPRTEANHETEPKHTGCQKRGKTQEQGK